jgi:DNA-binding LytR/AlgR family response regulator
VIAVAVVEDDRTDAQTLVDYVDRYSRESGHLFEITTFADGDDIVTGYRASFDIILMDVEMACMDGLAAAEHIRRIDHEVVIIFITNLAQHAIDGYKVDALDYVIKPVSYFAFSHRLDRAIGRMRRREGRFVIINAKDAVSRVPASSVLWIESRRHRLVYHTSAGVHESTTKSLKQVEDELRGQHFFRCHKSYLVNLALATGVERGFALLVNGTRVPVSESKRRGFLDALTNYVGEAVR